MFLNSRKNLGFENLEKRFVLSSWSLRPQIISPVQNNVREDTLSSIQLRIFDRDSNNINVSLNVSGGSLTIDNHNVFTRSTQNKLIISGNKINVNKTLSTLKYTPINDSNKTETLTVNVFDGRFHNALKSKIKIIPINDAPVISSENVIVSKNNFVAWNHIFSDVDSNQIQVSLRSNNAKIQIGDSAETEVKGNLSTINQIFSSGSIKITPENGRESHITINVSDGRSSSQKNITIIEKESVTDNAINNVLSRIQNNTSKNIFSIMDHENSVYIRNPNSWTNDLDLTPISPWNSVGRGNLAGTLISPRHIIYATHYQIPIGSKIRFVTNENVVIERVLTNKISPSYQSVYFPDLTVGILDSEVPSSIGFAKVLPENWSRYIEQSNEAPGLLKNQIPCLGLDQEEKALITGLSMLNSRAIFNPLKDESYKPFFENIIAGDSGNPAFMIVDNQLVLLTVWTFGYGGSGTSIVHQKNEINKMMKDLGGDYQLTEIDFSHFKSVF